MVFKVKLENGQIWPLFGPFWPQKGLRDLFFNGKHLDYESRPNYLSKNVWFEKSRIGLTFSPRGPLTNAFHLPNIEKGEVITEQKY